MRLNIPETFVGHCIRDSGRYFGLQSYHKEVPQSFLYVVRRDFMYIKCIELTFAEIVALENARDAGNL